MTTTPGATTDTEPLVTPNTFVEIAERIHTGKDVFDGVTDSGFVITTSNDTFVGYRESEATFVVARIRKKSETIGRSEPRIQTRENEYVEADLRRVESIHTDQEITIEAIRDTYSDAEKIDTGYINGYRLDPLSDVIDDVFKWHVV